MRISDWSSDVCSSDLKDGRIYEGGDWGQRPCLRLTGWRNPGGGMNCGPLSAIRRRTANRWAKYGSRRPSTRRPTRSEEHTSELQSLMRISYAVFCLKKKNTKEKHSTNIQNRQHTNRYTSKRHSH